MRILIIHNKYSKFSGEEAVVEAQSHLLTSNGHEVLTYFRSSEELESMPNSKIKAVLSGLYSPKSIREIKKLIQTKKPDIVHIHNLYPLISPSILPEIKKLQVPIVMTVHNYRLLCPNGLFFTNGEICEKCTGPSKEINCIVNNCQDSLSKSAGYAIRNFWSRKKHYYLKNVDLFLCLTKFQEHKLIDNGFSSRKCRVIPNFYNSEIEKTDYDIQERKYVAFSGRISEEKGISLLLEAAANLPYIEFQLAGSYEKNYLDNFEIPANVTFRGMLNLKDLHEFYRNARFLVLPSICYEGFPMVFPEAMAFMLPIIAPNMAGYPEIAIENFNGMLFTPGDSISLAETIDALWKNHELSKKFALNGSSEVKNKYSSGKHYNLLLDTYKELTNKKY